jgi:FtsP/CotA-like multicopper oxidase with cupredoxin domain
VNSTGQFPPGYTVNLAFTIDSGLYNEGVVNQIVQLNAVEEWTITNNATEDHNFHIHTNPFEVVARNGETLDKPVWYDTPTEKRRFSHHALTLRRLHGGNMSFTATSSITRTSA